jgi:mitochondrial fission protein ELM1
LLSILLLRAMTPTKDQKLNLLILNDGKQGHLKQSLAVASVVSNGNVKVVNVHYSTRFMRYLSTLLVWSFRHPRYYKGVLTWALKKGSLRELFTSSPDAVISTGASLHSINLALCTILQIKSIVVMKPSMSRQNDFDLRIIPQHDTPSPLKNTLVTVGAPTQISPAYIQTHAETLKQQLSIEHNKSISFFIGHPEESHVPEILKQLKRISTKMNRPLLVTTSRRTPASVIAKVQEALASFPLCKLLVVPTQKPQNDPFSGDMIAAMMGCSELLLVTQDSLSMISESASSGRRTIVIEATPIQSEQGKKQKMICTLINQGYVSTTKPNQLAAHIQQKLNDPAPHHFLEDNKRIQHALEKIL